MQSTKGLLVTSQEKEEIGQRKNMENLTQFLTEANESLPLIWKYKDQPMNTIDFMLDSNLSGDIQSGLFKGEDLTFEMSPDFISDNPGEAMRTHKMGELILAARRRFAKQGVEFSLIDVGPNGQRVHTGETLFTNMPSFVPAMRAMGANVRIRKMKDGTKVYNEYTIDELIDQQTADILGQKAEEDALVGLDVGRTGPTKQKQFVRYLTGKREKRLVIKLEISLLVHSIGQCVGRMNCMQR